MVIMDCVAVIYIFPPFNNESNLNYVPFEVCCQRLTFLIVPTGSAKARGDQLSWRDDSGERWDADTGIGSNACSTAPSSSTNSGKGVS